MSQFISKLQHKTYEKGEYINEQIRDIHDTLKLIKAFPWDSERPLTTIGLTGPSVTIKSDAGTYIKIGLYFSNKFAIYYLEDGDFYEQHINTLDEVDTIVNEFFAYKVEKSKFEKSLLSIGKEGHFITRPFIYSFNKGLWGIYMIFACLITTIFASIVITTTNYSSITLVSIATLSLGCLFIYQLINHYNHASNIVLQLSKGKQIFTIQKNGEITEYNKSDVSKVIVPYYYNNRNRIISYTKLVFNNGYSIKLSGLIIHPSLSSKKFPEDIIEHKPIFYGLL